MTRPVDLQLSQVCEHCVLEHAAEWERERESTISLKQLTCLSILKYENGITRCSLAPVFLTTQHDVSLLPGDHRIFCLFET